MTRPGCGSGSAIPQRSLVLEQRIERIVLQSHPTRGDSFDFRLGQVGDGARPAGEGLEALHLLILDRGNEIPRRPAVAGDGHRLTLRDLTVKTEIAGELRGWNFAHGI